MGVAILMVIVLGAGGAVLTAVYLRAYSRAGYDDWGNFLALMPMFSVLLLMLAVTPVAGAVLPLLAVALFGTPVLLVVRRCCRLGGKGIN
jgi:hypothetical protein